MQLSKEKAIWKYFEAKANFEVAKSFPSRQKKLKKSANLSKCTDPLKGVVGVKKA